MITGSTTFSNTMVQISATTMLTAAMGQSDIDGSGGLIHSITIMVPGHTFLDAIVDPFSPGGVTDLTVTATMSNGMTFTSNPLGGTGQNFMTITTTGG